MGSPTPFLHPQAQKSLVSSFFIKENSITDAELKMLA
jgi:hypothetical protein